MTLKLMTRMAPEMHHFYGGHTVRITVSFPPGFSVEGFVLSLRGNSVRVAMRDWNDAAIFEFTDGQWLAENGDACRLFTGGPPAGIPECAYSADHENSVSGLSPLYAFAG
jgi:hypothetical protein